MTMDTSEFARFAADAMDRLDAEHPNAKLGTVMLVLEVQDQDETGAFTEVHVACTDDRVFVQRGLLAEGIDVVRGEDSAQGGIES